MKRHRDLLERIVSFEGLLRAYRRARRAGRVRPQAAAFDYDLERNLLDLRDELLVGAYAPGPYRSFLAAEPKERLVSGCRRPSEGLSGDGSTALGRTPGVRVLCYHPANGSGGRP